VGADQGQVDAAGGASLGALWSLGATDGEVVRTQMRQFADAERLGDFLTGLFALAREQVQRHPDLVQALHEVMVGWSDDEFLTGLPAMRLAFTYFTPREKHHLALTLREALGLGAGEMMAALTVSVDAAVRAMVFEGRLLEAARRYGIRGGVQ
jgi:hypothetical protein